MKNIIDASPALKNHMGGPKDEIQFYEKKSKFKPLATSNNRMDGEICRHNLVIGYWKTGEYRETPLQKEDSEIRYSLKSISIVEHR